MQGKGSIVSSTHYVRSQAEQEFVDFLDSVCTPVDTSKPIVDPGRDYPQEKHDKREAHRHRYLMKHNFWYRQAHLFPVDTEDEQEPVEHGDTNFWEQFT